MHQLTAHEIETKLSKLEGWVLIDDANIKKLKTVFQTANYSQSIALTNAVANLAELYDHHPQIIVEYATVTVIWWTHSIKGLQENDFMLAAETSALFVKLI